MKLRDYQEAAVTAALSFLTNKANPLVVAPTGAGKTVIASEIIRRWQEKNGNRRCFFVAHRTELIEQAEATMRSFGLNATALSVWTKDYSHIPEDERKNGLCVFDEAHHSVASSWINFTTQFTGPKVAVTATPDRLDRQRIESAGFVTAYEIQIRKLIEEGHLVRPMAMKMSVRANGHMIANDDERLAALAQSVAIEFRRYNRKKGICFLPSIDVSSRFVSLLREAGIKAGHAEGSQGMAYCRKMTVEDFKTGDLEILCNVNLLTEGFDAPWTDCVILLRPTQSRALWSQMIGRGLRTYPGKTDCLILDPLWISGDHKLVPADAFITHPMAKREQVVGGSMPLDEASLADQDAEARLVAKLAKAERTQAYKDAKALNCIDLTSALDMFGFILPPAENDAPLMTPNQKEYLIRLQIHPSGEVTQEQASWLIDRALARQRAGLATPRQVRKLRQFGHRNAASYTIEQASKAIGSDWRIKARPFNSLRR